MRYAFCGSRNKIMCYSQIYPKGPHYSTLHHVFYVYHRFSISHINYKPCTLIDFGKHDFGVVQLQQEFSHLLLHLNKNILLLIMRTANNIAFPQQVFSYNSAYENCTSVGRKLKLLYFQYIFFSSTKEYHL